MLIALKPLVGPLSKHLLMTFLLSCIMHMVGTVDIVFKTVDIEVISFGLELVLKFIVFGYHICRHSFLGDIVGCQTQRTLCVRFACVLCSYFPTLVANVVIPIRGLHQFVHFACFEVDIFMFLPPPSLCHIFFV